MSLLERNKVEDANVHHVRPTLHGLLKQDADILVAKASSGSIWLIEKEGADNTLVLKRVVPADLPEEYRELWQGAFKSDDRKNLYVIWKAPGEGSKPQGLRLVKVASLWQEKPWVAEDYEIREKRKG